MKRAIWNSFVKKSSEALADAKMIDVKGRVIVDILNVRIKPKDTAKVIGQLKRGQIIEIFNTIEDWFQIVYADKKTAYVSKKHIEIVRQEKSGVITANVLNIRKQPNSAGEIIGKLKKGDIVNVLKELNEWVRIMYNGKEAYVSKQYISLSDVPLIVDNGNNSEEYFYKRKDLESYTLEALKQIQVTNSYHEKIAANTWNNFGNLISKVSKELVIDVATALSVLCVESSGKGFGDDNKMIIRFENHVLDMFWGKNNVEKFEQHFKYDKSAKRKGHYFRASVNDEWEVCHTSQEMEWKVLNFAKTLDETNALKSISMGAPQVMGFNHKFIGYASPQEMFDKFNKDIRFHLLALFDFCKYKPERIRYLQVRDFYSFSVEYNGTSAPAEYEARLKKYYDIFLNILPK
jgi:uncharacterized protein YgiM (DUF1202 family)